MDGDSLWSRTALEVAAGRARDALAEMHWQLFHSAVSADARHSYQAAQAGSGYRLLLSPDYTPTFNASRCLLLRGQMRLVFQTHHQLAQSSKVMPRFPAECLVTRPSAPLCTLAHFSFQQSATVDGNMAYSQEHAQFSAPGLHVYCWAAVAAQRRLRRWPKVRVPPTGSAAPAS